MDEHKRPVDIPFELQPASEAECLRHRLAVQKRAERLALRDRMRQRKKVRYSLDGQERARWGGPQAGEGRGARRRVGLGAGCFGRKHRDAQRGVAGPCAAASIWASAGHERCAAGLLCGHVRPQRLSPPSAHPSPAPLALGRSDSDSDGEKEAMRQALSTSTSNASEEAGAACLAGAGRQASP